VSAGLSAGLWFLSLFAPASSFLATSLTIASISFSFLSSYASVAANAALDQYHAEKDAKRLITDGVFLYKLDKLYGYMNGVKQSTGKVTALAKVAGALYSLISTTIYDIKELKECRE